MLWLDQSTLHSLEEYTLSGSLHSMECTILDSVGSGEIQAVPIHNA